MEETQRQLDDARNQLSISERKRIAIQQELEDARSLLEHVSQFRNLFQMILIDHKDES